MVNEEAAAIAREAGLVVVMNRCLLVVHERLIGSAFEGPAAAPGADPIGLCRDCRHARQVPAEKTTYWLCRRSVDDPTFAKYPRLPITGCRGFAWKA